VTVSELPHRVAADGRDAQYHVSWTQNQRSLVIYSAELVVTMDAGSQQLTLHSDTGHGFARDRDVGVPIHIAGAGADGTDLTTTIIRVLDAQTVVLADPAGTELQRRPVRLTWPCFLSADRGKGIRVEGAVVVNPMERDVPAGFGRQFYLNPGSRLALQTEIVAVHGPVSVELALPIGAPEATGQLCRISWGTDNSAAVVEGGLAAIAAGDKTLRFPPGLTCAWNITRQRNVGTVIGQLRWIGDGSRVIVTDQDANELFVQPSDPANRSFAPPARRVIARTQMPRMSMASAVKVAICGDSMSVFDLGGSPASSPVAAIIREMETQNPDKSFAWHDFSIGGATWAWLDQVRDVFPIWYSDPSAPWLSYVKAVAPDVVIAAVGGGNDGASVSLAAIESVLAKIRAMPRDAHGYPPDVMLMNARPEGRWRPARAPGPDGDEVTDRWFWQVQREIPNQLHRTYAARNGLAFLDYEDVAQRVLWGWSYQRSTLRRVPDCDPQICTSAQPLRFRRWCRDFSVALTIPGPDAHAAWATVGALSFQIGSRPDNLAIVAVSARGNLALQANAWGGTARDCTASIANGSPVLATGGEAVFDGDWAIGAGSNVLIHVRGGTWLTEADIGKPILLPRGGYNGEPLRSFIVWVGALPNQLGLADAAISSVGGVAGEVRYGGMLFMPSDARCRADIRVTIGPTTFAGNVTGYIDATHVTLSESWRGTDATGETATIFIGRMSLPPTETALNMTNLPGADPLVSLYARGTQLFVGYRSSHAQKLALQAFRGNVIRYGGPFEPAITPSLPGPVTLRATQCYVDEPIAEGQVLTDYEMWGDGNPPKSSPWDGNGLNHLTHMQLAVVDEPLLRVQDFAGADLRKNASGDR